jgi:aarF domain-containing kinase
MFAIRRFTKPTLIFGTTTLLVCGYVWYDKRMQVYLEGGIRFARSSYYIIQTMKLYKDLATIKPTLSEEEYRLARLEVHKKGAQLLKTLCLINQGTFIKAGQHLASLRVALPREYTEAFESFQDRAPFHSIQETQDIIKQEFGCKVEEKFTQFVWEPVASASIAQVHVAYIENEKVAVKVQHPKVGKLFESDLFAMQLFVKLAERYLDFTLGWILPEFREIVKSELNFQNEATNCDKFRRMFNDNVQISAPMIYPSYSGKRVLTMEYIDGCKVDNLHALEMMGIKPYVVSQLLTQAYAAQTFLFGFIHSDCHPGNLMMMVRNDKPTLVVLDHGCYQTLDEKTRLDYCNLWKSLFFRDIKNLTKYAQEFGIEEQYVEFMGLIMTLSDFFTEKGGYVDERKSYSIDQKTEFSNAMNEKWRQLMPEGGDVFDLVQKMFANGKRELILLLRVNSLLQNIHQSLGKPINRYEIMVKYAIIGLQRSTEEQIRRGIKMKDLKEIGVMDKLSIYFTIMYFHISLFFFKIAFKIGLVRFH